MDVAKVKSAIEEVRKQIGAVRNEIITNASAKNAGSDAIRQLNAIQDLGKADAALDKVVSRLDKALERTAPKAPKEDKKKKDAKK